MGDTAPPLERGLLTVETAADLGVTLSVATMAFAAAAAASVAALPRVHVPRYDPKSTADLLKAAQAAALPEQASGPLPQLVRDMSAAMASMVSSGRLM